MEEVHKAVLKRKRVHNDDDKIVPVPDKIRDRNTRDKISMPLLGPS